MKFFQQLSRRTERAIQFINTNRFLLIGVFIAFVLLYLFLMWDHVFWRDEARVILLVEQNATFSELYNAVRYEGTPMLWHLVFWVIAKIIPLTPFVMTVVHFVIYVAILAVVLFFLPLPNILKYILLFQPQFLHYATQVRQYPLALLGIFLFIGAYLRKGYTSVWSYLILALLIQVSVHALIIAGGLFLFMWIRRFVQTRRLFDGKDLIVLGATLLAIVQLIPPANLVDSNAPWTFVIGIKEMYLFGAFMSDVFLNTAVAGAFFALSIGVTLIFLWKKKQFEAWSIILPAILMMISFASITMFRYGTSPRHHWLLSYTLIGLIFVSIAPYIQSCMKAWKYSLFVLFVGSATIFYSTGHAYVDMYPSHGKNLVEYLDTYYPNASIIVNTPHLFPSAQVYSDQPMKMYALCSQEEVIYADYVEEECMWESSEKVEKFLLETPSDVFQEGSILIIAGSSDMLRPAFELRDGQKFVLQEEFTGARDNFLVYSLENDYK